MPLSEKQKIDFAFNFTVSNSSSSHISYSGGKEKYGLKTSVFPNLEYTVNFDTLSETDAKKIHRKLVWDRYNLNRMKSVEIAVKVYDLFFIFSKNEVTNIVRKALKEFNDGLEMSFSREVFGFEEIEMINEHYEEGRGTRFLNILIEKSLLNTSNDVKQKRIEKKPTVN